MTTALANIDHNMPAMTPEAVHAQVQTIQQVMSKVMQQDQHYGVIPGCGKKPTLLQPGAQKLALTFGFAVDYPDIIENQMPNGHREYRIKAVLTHRSDGTFVGAGVGCASTMEGKYRFRVAPKKLTDRPVPGEYWTLRKSNPAAAQQLIGGPGYSTKKNDAAQWVIAEGTDEKIEHDNPADYYNTILKMAKKRAYVDATLTACAASDIFTQDIEDEPELFGGNPPAAQPPQQVMPAPQPATQPTQSIPSATAAAVQPAANTTPPPVTQPAPQPAAANVDTSGAFRVASVEAKRAGTNRTGGWTLWSIKCDDGTEFDTFSNTIADTAKSALNAGQSVAINWTVDPKYGTNTIETLTPLQAPGQAPPAQAPAPTPVQPTGEVEQCNVVITEVTTEPFTRPDNTPGVVYKIGTDQGRFGTFDDAIGKLAQEAAGQGEMYVARYITEHRGKRLVGLSRAPWN